MYSVLREDIYCVNAESRKVLNFGESAPYHGCVYYGTKSVGRTDDRTTSLGVYVQTFGSKPERRGSTGPSLFQSAAGVFVRVHAGDRHSWGYRKKADDADARRATGHKHRFRSIATTCGADLVWMVYESRRNCAR